ncbi:MAG: 8-oxo-dGTP diphosphatase [Sporomusaceae bacterium]|nr:8-oxo-dGTP diphosphatase [Sporomusaceae bacterium]
MAAAMSRAEEVIITVLCMVYRGNKIVVQDRVDRAWRGIAFPGGHVEKSEPFVHAAIREVYEETGLTIAQPVLCGIKQFQTDQGQRYMVLLFKTDNFAGELRSSREGRVFWIDKNELGQCQVAAGFRELLAVFESDQYSEFYYERQGDNWLIKLF